MWPNLWIQMPGHIFQCSFFNVHTFHNIVNCIIFSCSYFQVQTCNSRWTHSSTQFPHTYIWAKNYNMWQLIYIWAANYNMWQVRKSDASGAEDFDNIYLIWELLQSCSVLCVRKYFKWSPPSKVPNWRQSPYSSQHISINSCNPVQRFVCGGRRLWAAGSTSDTKGPPSHS